MKLNRLTDEELLRHARAVFEPLVSTDLEAELARRYAEALDVIWDHSELDAVVEETPVAKVKAALDFASEHDLDNARRIFEVLLEHDIDTPGALRKQLERLQSIYIALQELANVPESLQPFLATTE